MHSLGPIQAVILRKGAAQKYQVKQRPHVLLLIASGSKTNLSPSSSLV